MIIVQSSGEHKLSQFLGCIGGTILRLNDLRFSLLGNSLVENEQENRADRLDDHSSNYEPKRYSMN